MTEAYVSARPRFKVAGRDRPEMEEAVSSVVVNLPLSGMAHAELVLTNWGLSEGQTEPDFQFQDIALGAAVEVSMGQDDPVTVFSGEVTGVEERYGEGAPRLVLLLQDPLHRLARRRTSRVFEERSADQVVQAIASDANLPTDVNVSTVTGTYHQVNESDYAFLQRLLARFDVPFRLQSGRLRARPEEEDARPLALNAQDDVLRLRLLADLNHQQTSACVMGFNAGADQAVHGTASALQPAPGGSTASDTLTQLGWAGDDVIPQPFPQSQGEAEAFARAHFSGRARRFLSGDLRLPGEAGLQSGREIELEGVSPRLRGRYRVVNCMHRFDLRNGYETHLRVARPDWNP